MTTGPKDASELAQACATDPSITVLLLEALANLGVVDRDGSGQYTIGVADRTLITMAAHGGSQLADAVRSGKPLARADTAEGASDLYPDLVPLLSVLFTPAAPTRRAATCRLRCRCPGRRGRGGAVEHRAGDSLTCRVTALDLPAVIATTRRAVEDADLRDRFEYLPADMFTCKLPPAAYDVVLLANICHLFDEERNRALLRRLRPTVRPVLTSPDPAAQRWIGLYALGLRLRTSQGAVHPLAAYKTWTSDAGFGPLQVEPLSAAPSLCLLACRTK